MRGNSAGKRIKKREKTRGECRSDEDDKWNAQYEAIMKYGEEHGGDCNVPASFRCRLGDGNEVNLGLWLSNQRYLKRQDTLRSDRQTKLQWLVDEGKFNWSFDATKDDSWIAQYDAMIQYGEAHGGDCNVPQSYKCVLGRREVMLGRWLEKQRLYKKDSALKEDRLVKIQQLVDQGKLRESTTRVWNSIIIILLFLLYY